MTRPTWDPGNVETVGTLAGLIARSAAAAPGATFIVRDGVRDLTFRDLDDCVHGIARSLDRRGVRPGDRVMTVLPNSPLAAVLFVGVAAAGRVLVPINPASSRAEIDYIEQQTEASFAILDSSLRNKCAGMSCDVEYVADSDHMLDQLRKDGAAASGDLAVGSPEDPAEIVFTSGSSGRPKGVVLSHRALLSNSHALGRTYEVGVGARFLTVCPLFHNSGQVFTTLTPLWALGSTVIEQPALALHRFWRMVDQHRPDWSLVMNAFLAAALQTQDDPTRHHRMTGVLAGGSPLAGDLHERFERRFGTPVYHVYGLTETTSVAAGQRPGRMLGDRSVGSELDSCVLRVRGDQDGEIEVRGSNLLLHYLNDKPLTRERVVDGWLRTGDVGRIDSGGNLFVLDRIDNMLIVGGENMYPGEVEHLAARLSGISEVMLVGVPDEVFGSRLVLVYAAGPGRNLTSAEWRRLLLPEIAAFKVPKQYLSLTKLGLNDFPRAPNNKILRGELQRVVVEYLDRDASGAPVRESGIGGRQ